MLQQFDDTLVKILLGAAGVSFGISMLEGGDQRKISFGTFVEPFVILMILIANATVGVVQENNSEKAIEVNLSANIFGFNLLILPFRL